MICDRCGEKMRVEDDRTRVFSISYEPLGCDLNDRWVTLALCSDCQKDLRREFYKRGLNKRPEEMIF